MRLMYRTDDGERVPAALDLNERRLTCPLAGCDYTITSTEAGGDDEARNEFTAHACTGRT
jgi:hypothetical protein